jgi:hypothetical protein
LQNFEVEKQSNLGPTCGFLALSADGLLVAKKDEVWLVDPGTFERRT